MTITTTDLQVLIPLLRSIILTTFVDEEEVQELIGLNPFTQVNHSNDAYRYQDNFKDYRSVLIPLLRSIILTVTYCNVRYLHIDY